MAILKNFVLLHGNVGNTPDVKYYDNGTVCANFSLATVDSRKDKDGAWKDETTWHSITAWGEVAKSIEKRVTKGSSLTVTGKLCNEQWEKEGTKHYKTFVKISEFIIHNPQKDSDMSRM